MKKWLPVLFILFFLILSTVVMTVLYIKERSDEGEESIDSSQSIESQEEDSEVVSDLSEVDEQDYLYIESYVDSLPSEDLSNEEIAGLIQMREEEKLAHDVYTKLYEKWGQKIFINISDSEQTHTDMVAEIMNKYTLTDVVVDPSVGVFVSPEMDTLYSSLVSQGEKSLVDALVVGATIEDLDIHDLDQLMKYTNNQDILAVYQNLQKGSRNHLRSYVRMLNRNGETYTPQYISESEYDVIIASPAENGVTYDADGKAI